MLKLYFNVLALARHTHWFAVFEKKSHCTTCVKCFYYFCFIREGLVVQKQKQIINKVHLKLNHFHTSYFPWLKGHPVFFFFSNLTLFVVVSETWQTKRVSVTRVFWQFGRQNHQLLCILWFSWFWTIFIHTRMGTFCSCKLITTGFLSVSVAGSGTHQFINVALHQKYL